jgi:hypothetical protein
MSKGKPKRVINPHECSEDGYVIFVVKRSERIDEFGGELPSVALKCERCGDLSIGSSSKECISRWNEAHPFPKRKRVSNERNTPNRIG